MDDQRFGTVIRQVRHRRQWRQSDLAARCGVSPSFISRLERGHVGPQTVDAIRAVASALEIRVDLVPRWRAGDLDRLLNTRHSALHESVARWFRDRFPAWTVVPEASFAIYGDRGIVDMLAWHPGRRAVLVIELKTDIADVNELVGTLDRKRRVAPKVAVERGRDLLVGPNTRSLNFSAHKDIPFSERLRAQFRAEFFNVTNHPNWGNPNAGVFVQGGAYNAIAGQITTVRVPMRQTQFALKFIF